MVTRSFCAALGLLVFLSAAAAQSSSAPSPSADRADKSGLKSPASAAPRRTAAASSHSPAVPVQKVEIEVPVPPVPREADLRPGMSRSEIVRKFGEPDAVLAWTNDGVLQETLTYHDRQTYTEMLFRDGKLAWSYIEKH